MLLSTHYFDDLKEASKNLRSIFLVIKVSTIFEIRNIVFIFSGNGSRQNLEYRNKGWHTLGFVLLHLLL